MTPQTSTPPATTAEIQKFLAAEPSWSLQGPKLFRKYLFTDFKRAFAFMTEVAAQADAADHHPEWSNVYNQVFVELITHDAGPAISHKDFLLAKAIEEIFRRYR